MSLLNCQKIKIKKVPYTETDPIFENWAVSYSALFYNTYTTVYNFSALWGAGTGGMDAEVRALTANWQNTYINFYSQSANNISVYSVVNSNSAFWSSTTALDVEVRALTSNWQNTYTQFSFQSANNTSVYSTVNSNSSIWNRGLTLFTEVSAITGINSSRIVHALSATSSATNVDVAIIPKGTGSFSLQIPDGTIPAGNKRGDRAVDFQRVRTASLRVASGIYSVIINGFNNTSSSTHSVIVNGSENTASSSYSLVVNGSTNGCTSLYSTVINGSANNSTGPYSTIINGFSNTVNNSYSTILGGIGNNCSSDYTLILNSLYAKADRYGQISKANTKFNSDGDAQRSEFLLYGRSVDGVDVELTLNNDSLYLTLPENTIHSCIIQILGTDEDFNYSQFTRKIVFRKISSVYSIPHVESIGTDSSSAGNCSISVDNAKGLVITCGSLPDNNTVWIASVNSVELFTPPPYTGVSMMSINNGINSTNTDINSLFS